MFNLMTDLNARFKKKQPKQKKSHKNTHRTTDLYDLNYGLIAKLISYRAENITRISTLCVNKSGIIFRLTG